MVPWKSFQQYLEGFLSIRFGDDENYVRNFLGTSERASEATGSIR